MGIAGDVLGRPVVCGLRSRSEAKLPAVGVSALPSAKSTCNLVAGLAVYLLHSNVANLQFVFATVLDG